MAPLRDRAMKGISARKRGWYGLATMASFFYEGAVRLRNSGYDRGISKIERLSCPVISVGNITAGGTGKTPMVITLAKGLSEKGYRPAVLSRGYGGRNSKGTTVVSDGDRIFAGPEEAGDEPVLIAESLEGVPVITGKSRFRAGRLAIGRFGADLLILDDAFQHRSLHRDVDIVLVNETAPFGNGLMLPRGELREPLRALTRADIIVMTDAGEADGSQRTEAKIEKKCPAVPLFRGNRRPLNVIDGGKGKVHSLSFLQGKRILAFAGIACPKQFRSTVEIICGSSVHFLSFPDHYRYGEDDVKKILEAAAAASVELIVTTEKDGVRLKRFPRFYAQICLLRIEMDMGDMLDEFIETVSYKWNQ